MDWLPKAKPIKYGTENLIVIATKNKKATKIMNGILVKRRFNSILKFSTCVLKFSRVSSGFLIILIFEKNVIHGPITKLWNPFQYPMSKTIKITDKFNTNPIIVRGQIGRENDQPPILKGISPIALIKSYLKINETSP